MSRIDREICDKHNIEKRADMHDGKVSYVCEKCFKEDNRRFFSALSAATPTDQDQTHDCDNCNGTGRAVYSDGCRECGSTRNRPE